jgi:hypothetical protein
MMVLATTAMRFLLVWVYSNTESLLLARLMHASYTGFRTVLVPLTLSPAKDTLFNRISGIVLWVTVAVAAWRYRPAMVDPTEAEERTRRTR